MKLHMHVGRHQVYTYTRFPILDAAFFRVPDPAKDEGTQKKKIYSLIITRRSDNSEPTWGSFCSICSQLSNEPKLDAVALTVFE
jgi:hypothetical protein